MGAGRSRCPTRRATGREVAATKAQFLGPADLHAPPTRAGAAARRVGTVADRWGEGADHHRHTVTITCHDGSVYGDSHRLATTLTDHRAWPAEALIALYHERWEHEITYLALRHTLLGGRVLRSGDPVGLEQEMWALLALYQALRIAVSDAVHTAPGTDPASYQIAVQTAQTLVTGARGILTETTDLAGDIGRAVLANLHRPRRPRVCARTVKSPLSRAGTSTHPANPHVLAC